MLHEARILPPMTVAPCGGGWALRAGIGVTINFLGHPMSVTRYYFDNEHLYKFIRVVYSFASFPSN